LFNGTGNEGKNLIGTQTDLNCASGKYLGLISGKNDYCILPGDMVDKTGIFTRVIGTIGWTKKNTGGFFFGCIRAKYEEGNFFCYRMTNGINRYVEGTHRTGIILLNCVNQTTAQCYDDQYIFHLVTFFTEFQLTGILMFSL
jgi:hypothetical protein